MKRYYIQIDHDNVRAQIRVNLWTTYSELQQRYRACRDPRTSRDVRAFWCGREGLPRASRVGVAGEINFTRDGVLSVELVSHECTHAAITLHSRVDLNRADDWEESVCDLVGMLTALILES